MSIQKHVSAFPLRARFMPAALLVAWVFTGAQAQDFRIIHPYEDMKPYPYKASLHNHSNYHPEYDHARIPSDELLRNYRDYETEPKYGIVALTEHSRVTTPWNTTPRGERNPPWGVEDILWIPGNEGLFGNRREGGLYGEIVIVNASTEETDDLNWAVTSTDRARSGWIYESREMPPSVELTFTGVGFAWIARTDSAAGIAAVYLNGEHVGEANLHSTETAYDQEVFSLRNLEEGEYVLRLEYDRKGESDRRFMARINVDTLIVYKADGTAVEYGARSPELTYQPYRYKHVPPRGTGRGVEEPLRMLREDGAFLALAHPNSRLETSGEHAGTQLWTSAGFTYDELDIIFGNPEKDIPPFSHLPQAIEVGNRGYDFAPTTGYRNAEEKWDYLLSQGHRVMGIATDDTHSVMHYAGWVVVYTNAPTRADLTLEDVMDSLFAGQFYASQGPNIEIEVEGNQFTVHADKPAWIEFISDGRVIHSRFNAVSATYTIQGHEGYVRGRVRREDPEWHEVGGGIGRMRSAWTNPLYVIREE